MTNTSTQIVSAASDIHLPESLPSVFVMAFCCRHLRLVMLAILPNSLCMPVAMTKPRPRP
ncbi:MAG: hypothetical protein V9G21_04590 [Methylotenera sp.]